MSNSVKTVNTNGYLKRNSIANVSLPPSRKFRKRLKVSQNRCYVESFAVNAT